MVTPREVLKERRNAAFRLLALSLVVLVAGIALATVLHAGTVGVVLLAVAFLGLNLLTHRALHATRCPACRHSWYHVITLIDRVPFLVRRARYCPFCGVDLDLPVTGPFASTTE